MDLTKMPLCHLADMILKYWPKPSLAAVSYINAMRQLQSIEDKYGCDDGESIVLYFLSNAGSWRGEEARTIKAELKRRVKLAKKG